MKKKLIAALLAMSLGVSMLFSACGNGSSTDGDSSDDSKQSESEEKEENSENKEAEDITLTIWVPENLRIEDWETNAMTVWMEEQTGYNLEIVPLASDDYATKINVSLTAGSIDDLPDIIMGDVSDDNVWSWAEAGTIIPLTDYYNDPELAVNINEAIERTGVDYTQQIISPDGNIYGIARYNQSYGNEFPGKIYIYQPWLDALEKDVPTTTEEFYELLKLVAETDLNGNGKNDEIGMLGDTKTCKYYWQTLMDAFVYAGDDQYRVVEDGTVSVAYTTDEWKNGLKYLKTLFDEGLIAPESLTIDHEQFKTLINSEDPTVFSFVYTSGSMISDETRMYEYVGIDTLTGPDGVNYAMYRPSTGVVSMVITANCENPEAAFILGDLMSSEYIGICQRWGEEGVDWDYPENVDDLSNYVASVEGFDIFMVEHREFWGGSDVTNGSWRQTGPFVRQYAIANGWGKAPTKSAGVDRAPSLYQNAGHEPDEVIPKLIYTTEEVNAVSEIETVLKSYVEECMASFVTGAKDIDAEWDSYLAELDKIGLDEYLEVVQNVYDRMYK